MDPQTPSEQIQAPAPNKKLFYGALAFLAVFIIFVIVAIISSSVSNSQKRQQNAIKESTSNTEKPNTQHLNPTQSAVMDTGWKTYKNELFSIEFPKDWKILEVKLQNGGVEIRTSPGANPNYANLIIIADSISSIPSIKEKQAAFVKQGFRSDIAIIDKQQASKLTGVLGGSAKTSSQSANAKSLQMTHIYLDHGAYSYLFDYSYLNSGLNLELENTINKIISTFKFLK